VLDAPIVTGVTVAGVLVGLLLGLLLGALLTTLLPLRPRRPADAPARSEAPAVPGSVQVIDALPVAVAVIDDEDWVVLANRQAVHLGLVQGQRLLVPELRRLARAAHRTGRPQEAEVEPERTRRRRLPGAVRVRVAPVEGVPGHVALLVEDVTEARRVDATRRDFVANVSHELKTPVGAMSLLSEALVGAADDPAAVRRFGKRLQTEASRLARLVQELIDLSRLQGADPLPEQELVGVDRIVADAVERTRAEAAARGIEIVQGGEPGLTVCGSRTQLVTAVRNLLENAVHYSPEHTSVAVASQLRDGTVEITVSDQGMGIAEKDLQRVFERFYRADPARSRATGGTGLGLAIVKHVVTNHGGEVDVWSVEGSGSTFTIRLPPPADGARTGGESA
jgi:two-component system sensor histidine kinase SenX3